MGCADALYSISVVVRPTASYAENSVDPSEEMSRRQTPIRVVLDRVSRARLIGHKLGTTQAAERFHAQWRNLRRATAML
jgi:hypothetical protein